MVRLAEQLPKDIGARSKLIELAFMAEQDQAGKNTKQNKDEAEKTNGQHITAEEKIEKIIEQIERIEGGRDWLFAISGCVP